MKTKIHEPKTCSYAELSQLTGLNIGTLYAMVGQKRIPHYRIGPRHVVFDQKEIQKWFDEKRIGIKEAK